MARTDFKKAVQERNLVAHVEVMKNDHAEILANLSENSKMNSLLKQENESLRVEGAALKEENERICKDSLDKSNRAQTMLDNALSVESSVQQVVINSIEEIVKLTREAQDKLKASDRMVEDNEDLMTKQMSILSDLAKDITKLTQMREEVILTDKAIRDKIRVNEETTKLALSESNNELRDISNKIKEARAELLKTEQLVLDEKSKVEMPYKALQRDVEKVSQQKKDLDIYASQVRMFWNKIHPNSPMIL